MIIDTTKIQVINSFSILESLKEAYEIIWLLVPILTLVLGITIGVLVIPLGNSSSSSKWYKTAFQRELSSILRRWSFIQYRTLLIYFGYHLILANLGIGGFYASLFQASLPLDFLCGLWAAAQSISYEIPLTLCVLSIFLRVIWKGLKRIEPNTKIFLNTYLSRVWVLNT
ncbi:hypothetical protein M9H77_19566 [Catharanthus roseus]|uniref:Uncharacterized protein n=1 Tax=Catharanthus roseus TaxID=4058 RepID=A0ACC0BAZ0_CATRO|nr:hypothetical protein M9H77_19566 [Catharanthus roseus]